MPDYIRSMEKNPFTQHGLEMDPGVKAVPLDELADYIEQPGAMEALELARKAGGQYDHGERNMAALKALRDVHSRAGAYHRQEQERAERLRVEKAKQQRSEELSQYIK